MVRDAGLRVILLFIELYLARQTKWQKKQADLFRYRPTKSLGEYIMVDKA